MILAGSALASVVSAGASAHVGITTFPSPPQAMDRFTIVVQAPPGWNMPAGSRATLRVCLGNATAIRECYPAENMSADAASTTGSWRAESPDAFPGGTSLGLNVTMILPNGTQIYGPGLEYQFVTVAGSASPSAPVPTLSWLAVAIVVFVAALAVPRESRRR
ncbi:MAG: hypothetical protein ACYDDF_13055 [Thermoplasmatota archaeon]